MIYPFFEKNMTTIEEIIDNLEEAVHHLQEARDAVEIANEFFNSSKAEETLEAMSSLIEEMDARVDVLREQE